LKKIILIGRTCSGKGRLLDNLLKLGMKFDVISPGDIFRKEKKIKSSLWKEVEACIEKGFNAPDDITNEIVGKHLKREHSGIPQFLDGFPRSVSQVRVLFQVPANYMVVHVDTPESVCRARFVERGRHDDHLEAFENKMKVFREQVKPALKVLREAFGVVEIDGRQTDHQYAKVVNYCRLEEHICPSKANQSVLDEYALWSMHHPDKCVREDLPQH
jgi:adenylate kinase